MHQHRFDERTVIESMEDLLRLPAVADSDLGVADRVEPEIASERVAERGRQRPDQGSIRDAAVLPDGVGDLPDAI